MKDNIQICGAGGPFFGCAKFHQENPNAGRRLYSMVFKAKKTEELYKAYLCTHQIDHIYGVNSPYIFVKITEEKYKFSLEDKCRKT
jgi:hypothetical protein